MSFSVEKAAIFFATHLQGNLWEQQSEHDRSSSLEMATNDIALYLHMESSKMLEQFALDHLFVESAVYEQAIYLLSRRDQLLQKEMIASESIDGIGSRSYRESGDTSTESNIAPRALHYLNHLTRTNKITRG